MYNFWQIFMYYFSISKSQNDIKNANANMIITSALGFNYEVRQSLKDRNWCYATAVDYTIYLGLGLGDTIHSHYADNRH